MKKLSLYLSIIALNSNVFGANNTFYIEKSVIKAADKFLNHRNNTDDIFKKLFYTKLNTTTAIDNKTLLPEMEALRAIIWYQTGENILPENLHQSFGPLLKSPEIAEKVENHLNSTTIPSVYSLNTKRKNDNLKIKSFLLRCIGY